MFRWPSNGKMLGPIASLALVLAACSSGLATTAPPTTTPPTTTASPSAVIGSPTPTASLAPSTPAGPIAEGTYVSSAVTVATIIARINADTKLTAAQKATDIEAFAGHKTQTASLDFHGGRFTESDSFDGAPLQVDVRAIYAFPDDHTLVIQEQGPGVSTFDVTTSPNGFTLKYRVGAPNAGEDILGQVLYESTPFTPVP
jgi:hypothetical protein